MADPLPYMFQLSRDYYLSNLPPPVAAPVPEPPIYNPITPPDETPPSILTGVWVGDTPPDNPSTGAMWQNTANNGFYIFTEAGVWEQTGTNW